ncbi:unnamed protein product [Vitrella brassicaformis CCMP3155]|uniref:Uncharacterized protein n=1 Tax=Vitrella brassicaformis (strain CCMP3155) TaxID=1169540 RepID=A0A0G4FWC8_VITBC|nr:unnamed protein product [Vitrella brassicaformis CCMP3155]|eukprot:CEM19059.1 unnamed protein product [Vitrella brassicaformis CCMP3155]
MGSIWCCNLCQQNKESTDEEVRIRKSVEEKIAMELIGNEVHRNPSQNYLHGLLNSMQADSRFGAGTASEKAGHVKHATPRQAELRTQIQLPPSDLPYPLPPVGFPTNNLSDSEQRYLLIEMYRDFIVELYRGVYVTQLTSARDYSEIHCQLKDDLTTLTLDQNTGRLIEFPLKSATRVYQIWRRDGRTHELTHRTLSERRHDLMDGSRPQDFIVIVEFLKRKLAFVFRDTKQADRFLVCMELLIQEARQPKPFGYLFGTPGTSKVSSRVPTARHSPTVGLTPR